MNLFTIKDLENLSGIKAHTIRIWEQRYDFIKPSRTKTNIRFYSGEELKTILNVSLLNKYGFKVSHINKMTAAELQERILSLNQVEAQQERLVNELIQCMIEVRIDRFEKLLNNSIAAKGIERTIPYLIFPFLEKLGILWLTSHINPAQEHLVSNIIRQKIIVGIDKINTPSQSDKTVLLFLPEGEYHEIGLLYVHYILKNRGIKVVYLGASIPMKDVCFVINHEKIDYLYTHLTSVAKNFQFDRFLENISVQIPKTPLIISGYLANNWQKKIPPTVGFKRSINEVTDYVNSL